MDENLRSLNNTNARPIEESNKKKSFLLIFLS